MGIEVWDWVGRPFANVGLWLLLLGLTLAFGIACQPSATSESQPTVTATSTAQATSISTSELSPQPLETASPTVIPSQTPTVIAVTISPTVTAIILSPTLTSSPVPSPTPSFTPEPSTPAVKIGDVVFEAEIADTPSLRTQGLSERDSLPSQTGMLFVFESGRASSFWMNKMRFPLDFVWIGEDCTVVSTTVDVPNPEPNAPSSSLPTYQSGAPAAYNFEINAGEVARFGIEVGDEVTFLNVSSTNAGC